MKMYSRVYFSLCLFLAISGRSRFQGGCELSEKLNPREKFPMYGILKTCIATNQERKLLQLVTPLLKGLYLKTKRCQGKEKKKTHLWNSEDVAAAKSISGIHFYPSLWASDVIEEWAILRWTFNLKSSCKLQILHFSCMLDRLSGQIMDKHLKSHTTSGINFGGLQMKLIKLKKLYKI